MFPEHLRSTPARLDLETLRRAAQTNEPPYPGPRLLIRDPTGAVIPRPTAPPPGLQPRRAAVLVLFYPCQNTPTLLLIRRTDHLEHHGGQIGLPGGAIEPDDASPLAAALREAQEEIGLDNSRLTIWGQLEPTYISVSNFLVDPFIAWCAERPDLRPDPSEVAEVLEASVAALLHPSNLVEEEWYLNGRRQIVPFFRLGPHKVWGATALILDQVRWRLEQAGWRPDGPVDGPWYTPRSAR